MAKGPSPVTARDLMAALKKDKAHQTQKKMQDQEVAAFEKLLLDDEKPMLDELAFIGVHVNSVWDFINDWDFEKWEGSCPDKNFTPEAIKILIDHLQQDHHPRTIQGIVRSLADNRLSDLNELWNVLEVLYGKHLTDEHIKNPQERGVQYAIALALSELAKESRLESMIKIIKNHPNGDGIEMLEAKIKSFQ